MDSEVQEMLYFSNEFIFLCQSVFVAFFAIGAVFFGVGGLTSLVALCALLSNLFIGKQATLFGFDVVTCDALVIGSDIAIHLIYEYFGKKAAEKAIQLCLYLSIFFIGISQLFLWYTPNVFDTSQSYYQAIFGPMPWIIGTSCIVALMTKVLNLTLYHLFSVRWGRKKFFTKTILALLISQLFDTVAFTLIALSSTVHSVIDVIIFSYAVKCIAIFSGIPFVSFLRRFLPFSPHSESEK